MATTTVERPAIGTVFVSSWGYEQTNVTAYEVVSHHGKATLGLRRIAVEPASNGKSQPYDGWAGTVKPVPGRYVHDELVKRRPLPKASTYRGAPTVKLPGDHHAEPWDGERVYYKSSYA